MTVEGTGSTTPEALERALTRRVAWSTVLVTVLGWCLIIVGAVVLDGVARAQVEHVVAQRAQAILGVGHEHPVIVEVGGGPLILQLLSQRFDRVDVVASNVALGELVGDARLTATGVPLDVTQPLERVELVVSVSEDVVSSIAARVTDSAVTRVTLSDPLVRWNTTVTIPALVVFGITITEEFRFDVGVGMEPFVADGRLAFTPVSFTVNGTELSAEAFADAYRSVAQVLTRAWATCVAEQLPAVLVLESAEVRGSRLVVSLGAEDAIFSAEALATRGTCG